MTTATIDDHALAERDRRARVAAANLRRFRPGLALGFQQELRLLAGQLRDLTPDDANSVVSRAIAASEERQEILRNLGLTPTDLLPTARYAATLRILRDLILQGWDLRSDDEGVILEAPGRASRLVTDPEREKEALRQSFSFARMAQLHEPATTRFIEDMERRGIGALFADGAELAERLLADPDSVQPELELIEPGSRDPLTGLLLQDIWRYARHFWSIPYQSTPGRNLFYIVRDAAVHSRPLIGIAALGNPVLGVTQRDDYFCWTVRGLRTRLTSFTAEEIGQLGGHLYSIVVDGFDDIYSHDIWPDGRPTDWRSAVKALEALEGISAAERLEQLDEAQEGEREELDLIRKTLGNAHQRDAEDIDWTALARTALYRRKRAGTLADLMRASGTLRELGFTREDGDLHRALESEEGTRAVEIALRRIKRQVIGSNVMELITCGALPPYRDVLGGKLVAMLMLSREVVRDVDQRYSGRVTLISSALAGRPIFRPARLALITTSSLYEIASSQYNRIRIPVGVHDLTYKRIGTTASFGTIHFGSDTVSELSNVARLANHNRREVNNLFGEGTSPKLRLVRSGLDALGLDSDTFLRHQAPRLLYAASLCSNIDRLLLGLTDEPAYILPPEESSIERISKHWRARWLRRRAGRSEILGRIRAQNFQRFKLSTELRAERRVASSPGVPAGSNGSEEQSGDATHTLQSFVERLYRSSKSYADRLSQDELDAIDVDLGTEEYLLEHAEAGRQIVVTGNPGDGKTHLIERMRTQLERLGARVITDANACSDEKILDIWEACRSERRPFVLAINEWPLFVLQRLARSRQVSAVDEALRQVTTARYFVEAETPEEPKDDVVVIDLSLRNLLAPSVVLRVIEKLTQDRFYSGLNPADPILANRRALQNTQVQERLVGVLQLVAARVTHITMRQLVGFIAFLLTGGQSAAERMRSGQDSVSFAYSNLAFGQHGGGIGPLFDAVRDTFDPASFTHPNWDTLLWLGETNPQDWMGQPPPSILALPGNERDAAYQAVKRRFYFEHTQGRDLLNLVPSDEREFGKALAGDESGRSTLVRKLVLALNRFYEPDCSDTEQDRLQLWQSHRYDVRSPSAFFALQTLPHDQLRIEPLRLASWVSRWLPQDQKSVQSFGLVARTADRRDVALLEVDRDLFLTLVEAQRGLGRASWSRSNARRITRFIDRIQRSVDASTGVEDLRIRNVESDLDERFGIQRTPPRYLL